MGTQVTILAPPADLAAATALARDLFDHWEDTLSRFRPESELSRLNQVGAGFVSELLLEVLQASITAARRTHGVFDPTLLPHLVAAGYDRDFAAMKGRSEPRRGDRGAGLAAGAWRGIEVDAERRFVRLPAGAGLDLGGIAKGMAVDAASAELDRLGLAWHAVDAGGDLRVSGLPAGFSTWPVAVEAGEGEVTIGLRSGALATSSVLGRRWLAGDQVRHHLIDPRTGVPARTSILSVTAAAPTCEAAEVAAKAALILGPGFGATMLASLAQAGLIVLDSGRRIAVGGWPGEPLT